MGVGCGQKPHQAQVSSLGQKGQEERRARGKGRVGGRTENSGLGLQRGWWTALELPVLSLSLHTQGSAMARGRGTALPGSQR